MEEINPLNDLNAERIGKQTTRTVLLILGVSILAFLAYHLLIRPKLEDHTTTSTDSQKPEGNLS